MSSLLSNAIFLTEPPPRFCVDTVAEGGDKTRRAETDLEILRELAAGRREALERLWSRWGRSLFAVAMKALPAEEDAEEVLQDLLVKLWQKAPEYDAARALPFTWATLLLRGLIIDRLRYVSRRPSFLAPNPDAPEPPGPPPLSFEHREALRRALDALSPEERELLDAALFSPAT